MCVCVCINERPQMQKNPHVSSLPSVSAFLNSCSPGGRLDLVQPFHHNRAAKGGRNVYS
jgi:hypothetical protein